VQLVVLSRTYEPVDYPKENERQKEFIMLSE
jgi:hypothetical protein